MPYIISNFDCTDCGGLIRDFPSPQERVNRREKAANIDMMAFMIFSVKYYLTKCGCKVNK